MGQKVTQAANSHWNAYSVTCAHMSDAGSARAMQAPSSTTVVAPFSGMRRGAPEVLEAGAAKQEAHGTSSASQESHLFFVAVLEAKQSRTKFASCAVVQAPV